MPSSLRRFYFLQADIQSDHLLQIKHSDTLNMAADINATIENRLKEFFKMTTSFHLLELDEHAFPLVFIPKHCNYA